MEQRDDPRTPGWKRDPWRRFAGRYWDGDQWTEHVVTAEKTLADDPVPPWPPSPIPPPPDRFPDEPASTRSPRPRPAPKAGGIKVWKIALGVALGIFLFMGACAAFFAGGVNNATEKKAAVVRIEAPPGLCWSGSIGDATRDGCGPARFDIETTVGNLVSANVQKQDDSAAELVIIAEIDGEEVGRNSTTAAYGVAQVTSSL